MSFIHKTKMTESRDEIHDERSRERILAAPAAQDQPAAYQAKVTTKAVTLGLMASMGGMIFGYESGQISGMPSSLMSHSSLLKNSC